MDMEDDEVTNDDVYTVSVTYDCWMDEDYEIGEASDRGYELEDEVCDVPELRRLHERFDFSEPSSHTITATQDGRFRHVCFHARNTEVDDTDPSSGTKYFSCHLVAVNGAHPTAEDMQRLADIFEAKFRGPRIPLPEDTAPTPAAHTSSDRPQP